MKYVFEMQSTDEILNPKNLKRLGYIIIGISVIFIIREIYFYFHSVSINEINKEGGILGDLFRYKQDSLYQGYLWILFFLLGIGFVKQNLLGWIIPQTYLLIGNIPFIIFIVYESFDEIKYLVLVGLIYSALNLLIIRYLRKPRFVSSFHINLAYSVYYYLLIGVFACIYWVFQYYGNLIIK